VTLFETDSLYREKATIWRVFSLTPLYGALAAGRVWRWFAINIPMDLGTGEEFTSDIDIIARLSNPPHSKEWIYRTWEVKVSLLCKDGTALSLKAGKIARTITQLRAYREFGSPDVSLLDIYLCESGFMSRNIFPPPSLKNLIVAKIAELSEYGFGYQLLPFEHGKDGDVDVGLHAIMSNPMNPLQTTFNILPALPFRPRDPFARLADRINHFFEQIPNQSRNYIKNQIVFCKGCRRLQYISMRDTYTCPNCQSNLIIQS
jgi:hypothetical protein